MHVDRCGTSSVSQPRWVVKADLQHPCKTLNCKVLSRVLSPTSPSRVLHIVATDTAANTALPPPVCVGARRSVRECYTPVDVVRDWRKEERVVRVSTARDVHKRKWSPAEGWISNTYTPLCCGPAIYTDGTSSLAMHFPAVYLRLSTGTLVVPGYSRLRTHVLSRLGQTATTMGTCVKSKQRWCIIPKS